MTTSPPFTEAVLTTVGEDAGDNAAPCVIARNASYVASQYRAYASADAACTAAKRYFLTIAKVYAALGTWLNGFCVVVIFELKHAIGGRETKFPRVQLAASLLLFVTVVTLTPVYVSIMMLDRPDVRGWLMSFVHSMWATVVNIALFFMLLLMVNVELIYRRFEGLLTGNALHVCSEDGSKKDLGAEISRLVEAEVEEARRTGEEKAKVETRFASAPCDLVCGQPKEAALGVNYYMKVSTTFQLPAAQVCEPPIVRHADTRLTIYVHLPIAQDAVRAIVEEFERSGSDIDRECVDYVLNQRAGESLITFANGNLRRDCDHEGNVLPSRVGADGLGKRFADFVNDPRAKELGKLQPAHVLALRVCARSRARTRRASSGLRSQSAGRALASRRRQTRPPPSARSTTRSARPRTIGHRIRSQ